MATMRATTAPTIHLNFPRIDVVSFRMVLLADRQLQREGGTTINDVGHRSGSAVLGCDSGHDRQAEAGAVADTGLVSLPEAVEYVFQGLGIEPLPVVPHDHDGVAVL